MIATAAAMYGASKAIAAADRPDEYSIDAVPMVMAVCVDFVAYVSIAVAIAG